MSNKHIYLQLAIGAGMLALSTVVWAQAPTSRDAVDWTVLETYCGDCHNSDDFAGGTAFDVLTHDSLAKDAATWEKAIRKIRTGMMPPAGKPRPPRPVLDAFIAVLGDRLDTEAAMHPHPGNAGIRRLNRAEYTNVIRDLLGFDAAGIVATLPPDESSHGFDNMSDVLSVSPTLIDSYLGAAMRIGREAVGDNSLIPSLVKYPGPSGAQTRHVDGLPLGTRGGMVVTHNFPLDAKYEIQVKGQGAGGIFNNQAFCPGAGPDIFVSIDGEPLDVKDASKFQLQFPAGPHRIGVALADNKHCEGVNDFYDSYSVGGAIAGIEINGPFEAKGPGETPSRKIIFNCYPAKAEEESSCAQRIMTTLASRAYRHPVVANSPEIATLMQFYEKGRKSADFETGIQYGISRLLIDPRFLYQGEQQPEALAPDSFYAISDLELASRLSFFLWSSIPDRELLDVAVAGHLHEPAQLEKQTRRMLRDEKAKSLVNNFAAQWLKLRELDAALPQDAAFNSKLRKAFRAETELLFTDVIAKDLSVLHLFNPDYAWLNEELAHHYGINGVRGDYMRRVTLPADSPRRGLLGNGSILTATSAANRTSPVIRGEWIVENILGAPVPTPPPGVETDLTKETAKGRVTNTLRERIELHRENPTCAACHQIMDPIGLALENFDLVGRWRDKENGYPLDTRTKMIDGTAVDGPVTLRNALLSRSDSLVTTITEKLMMYGLARGLDATDMPAVRKVVHGAAGKQFRFSDIVTGIVNSQPFLMRSAAASNTKIAALEETKP